MRLVENSGWVLANKITRHYETRGGSSNRRLLIYVNASALELNLLPYFSGILQYYSSNKGISTSHKCIAP